MYCAAHYFTFLYITAQYCAVLYGIVKCCAILYSTVRYCAVLYNIVRCCKELYGVRSSFLDSGCGGLKLSHIVRDCIIVKYIAQYFTVMYSIVQ